MLAADRAAVRSFRGLQCPCGRLERLVEERFEKAAAGAVGGSEAGLQPVAEGHQGIDPGHESVLFGKRREGMGSGFSFAALIPFAVMPVAFA